MSEVQWVISGQSTRASACGPDPTSQPLRTAKRTMLCSVASAPTLVFSEHPIARTAVRNWATSSTVIVPIARRPRAETK